MILLQLLVLAAAPPLAGSSAGFPAVGVSAVGVPALGVLAAPQEARAARGATPGDDEVERAKAWPKYANQAALKRSVSKLRKARTEEMATSGAAELEAIGAAAAPLLLDRIGAEQDAGARERMAAVLDAITAPTHTRLLAEVLESRAAWTRRYAARRIAQLGDPGLREVAEEYLRTWIERAADDRMKKPVDPLDLHRAAILCVATGSPDGLERCLALAVPKTWEAFGADLEAACTSARAAGSEVGADLGARLGSAQAAADRVALLRLLTYAGREDQVGPIAPLLDVEQNHVKVAAINALRMIVDGDPPLRRLSSFDAIERANRWKARLSSTGDKGPPTHAK